MVVVDVWVDVVCVELLDVVVDVDVDVDVVEVDEPVDESLVDVDVPGRLLCSCATSWGFTATTRDKESCKRRTMEKRSRASFTYLDNMYETWQCPTAILGSGRCETSVSKTALLFTSAWLGTPVYTTIAFFLCTFMGGAN